MLPEDYATSILEGKIPPSSVRVDDEEEALSYAQLYGNYIFFNGEEEPVRNESEIQSIPYELFRDTQRCEEMVDLYGVEFVDRLEEEIDYFNRTNNAEMVIRVADLVQRFKEEGVVWGVGRGSACASVLLYILEVHDIDPLKYNIPFSELSKEISDYASTNQ